VPSSAVATRLQNIWYRQSKPPWLLRGLSRIFGLLISLRTRAYSSGLRRRHRISRPVIVVGNLTVGGTGKTPLVIWLVKQLRAQGLAPGVVLRGYGGQAGQGAPRIVELHADPLEVGDEAVLLRLRTGAPVVIGRDRVRAAQRLVEQTGANVVIADDGLQHLRLQRDFEIAVIDASRGLGNGYLLPAGPLREPRSRLGSVGAIVLNVSGDGDGDGGAVREAHRSDNAFTMRLLGEQLLPLDDGGEPIALRSLAGQPVHAIAGVGNPQRFFRQLSAAGLRVQPHPLPDHHRYRASDLEFGDALPLLMTEKDAVKCRRFAAANRWYLPVEASFAPDEGAALMARLQPMLMR
jgi:tetraacyldisaccharide 4'-kinase